MGELTYLNKWLFSSVSLEPKDTIDARKAEFTGKLYQIPNREFSKNLQLAYRMREYEIWHSENIGDLINWYAMFPNQPNEMGFASRRNWYEWCRNAPNLPKVHIPIASLINTFMTQLMIGSGEVSIKINNSKKNDARLQKILKKADFQEFVHLVEDMASYSGTVAIVPVINPAVSDYPFLSAYPAERLDYEQSNGKITAVITIDEYQKGEGVCYRLFTKYSKGKVEYSLFNQANKVPLDTIEETRGYKDLKIEGNSPLFGVWLQNAGRSKEFNYTLLGASDYEGSIDILHLCDEIISTTNAYIRRTRPSMAIEETLFPLDPLTRTQRAPDEWELDIIKLASRGVGASTNGEKNMGLQREIPQVDLKPFYDGLVYFMTFIWLKIGISPASTGLSTGTGTVGANTSSQALYLREQATHSVRNLRIGSRKTAYRKAAALLLYFDDIMTGKGKNKTITLDDEGKEVENTVRTTIADYDDLDIIVSFGELDSEDFITRMDTAIKGLAGGVLSQEYAIEYAMKYKYTQEEVEDNIAKMKEALQELAEKTQRAKIDNMHKTTDVKADSIKQ